LFDLSEKVALVTGGSRGMGEAMARGFAAAGARVAISARHLAPLEAVAADLRAQGHEARAYAAHSGRAAEVAELVASVERDFGGLDIVVANAATNPYFGPVLDGDESHFDKTFEVNVKGAFLLARAAAPCFRRRNGGSLILMTSIAAFSPLAGLGIYSMTKAALVMMAKCLAIELAADHIRVNAIAPGVIDTRFAATLLSTEEQREAAANDVPLGRIGQPHDVVGTACYLASDASAYVTGQTLVVDGGATL
jgi:NAD(P)-dependent dehydrogenase (short-subunit alcohol dehydrogenase family)